MGAIRDAEELSETREGWDLLVSFLPDKWAELAGETGALEGLREDKSVDSLLRTLLMHLARGHSLRETVMRAKKADPAVLLDVAMLKRLKKSKAWLHALCAELFRERGFAVSAARGFQVRAFGATTVKLTHQRLRFGPRWNGGNVVRPGGAATEATDKRGLRSGHGTSLADAQAHAR